MQIFQSLAQKGSQFSVTYPNGTTGTKTARYDVGEIKGKYRDMLAVIADTSGFDGLGFDSTVGSADDSWHTINLFTQNHRYIDTVAVAGADDSDHAIYVALSQFDYLEPDYGKLVANDPENGFDNLGFSADTIQKLLDNLNQSQHYLPIISKKMLLDEQHKASFDDVAWDGLNLVSHGKSFDNLYRDMLKHDTFGELTQKFSLREALAQLGDIAELGFDSLMDTHNRLQLMGDRLYRGLVSAGDKALQVTSFNLTKPFKRQGVANVAMEFGLSDGQTFSIFFKNPDADPAKIGANDVMVSWKWLLNKKDITAVVQPENGANVQLSQVAMRMMKLAKANMSRFAKAQAQKIKNEQEINNAKQAVADKQALLETLDKEIADLQGQIDVKRHEHKQAFGGEAVENQIQSDEMISLTGNEFGEFDLTDDNDVKEFAEKVYQKLNDLNGEVVFNKSLNAKVKLNSNGLGKIRRFNGLNKSPIKLQAVARLKEIVANAKLFRTDNSYDTGGKVGKMKYYYLKTPFFVSGVEYGARVVVRGDGNGNFYYDFQLKDDVNHIFDALKIHQERDTPYDWETASMFGGLGKNSTQNSKKSQATLNDFQVKDNVNVILDSLQKDSPEEFPLTHSGLVQGYETNVNTDDNESQAIFDKVGGSTGNMVLNLFIFDEHGNEIKDEISGSAYQALTSDDELIFAGDAKNSYARGLRLNDMKKEINQNAKGDLRAFIKKMSSITSEPLDVSIAYCFYKYFSGNSKGYQDIMHLISLLTGMGIVKSSYDNKSKKILQKMAEYVGIEYFDNRDVYDGDFYKFINDLYNAFVAKTNSESMPIDLDVAGVGENQDEPQPAQTSNKKAKWYENQPDNVSIYLIEKSRGKDYLKITENVVDVDYSAFISIAGVGGEFQGDLTSVKKWIAVRTQTMFGGQSTLKLVVGKDVLNNTPVKTIDLIGNEFDYEQNSQEIDVSNIDTDLDKYGKDNKTAVIKFLKTLQGKYINTQIGKVLFNAISTKELSFKTRDDELRAKIVLHIPNTLQKGEYLGRDELYKERKDSFVAFHTFKGVAQIDDSNVEHTVKVGERADGEFVFVAYHSRYDMLDSIAKKNEPPFQHIGGSQKPVFDSISNNMVGRSQTGLDDIVPDEAGDVNDDIIIDDDTPSLFDSMMFDDIADDTDGWNIQIISITPITNKAKELFGKTKPVSRLKLLTSTSQFRINEDHTMWSNGHILVKQNLGDDFYQLRDEYVAEQQRKNKPIGFNTLQNKDIERLIPPKAIQLQLIDLATSADKKETQLAILKTEQGNEVAIDKTYLQFFIKEFGNQLEYWGDDIDFEISNGGNGTKRPISLYKGGEFIGLIMPTTHNYIKHSEQEPKQDKPVITEIVNPYDESQVQEKLKNAKQKYENFGEKSLAPHEKMPANGQTVKLENARQFLLDKVLKGKQKNVIFTFKDDKGNLGFKIGVDTNANRRKLIDAFGEIDTHRLPHEQAGGQANGGDITSARILERLGYVIDYTEKETFYPKSALPIKNQFYQIDLNGHQGAYLFVGIINKQQLKDEADLRFLDLESDYLMSMKASRYDELMNANKIVKIDDMTTITELVNHNAKKEHSIYQTRANGQIIKVFAKGNRYHIEQYQNVNDKSPYTVEVDSKSEAVSELQRIKKHYPVLKFVTGVENLLELTIKEPVKDNEAVENLEKDFFNMAKRFGFKRQDIEKETYNLDNGGKVNQYVIDVFFDDYPEVTLYTEYHYNSSQGTKVISRMSDDGELWLIENNPLKGLQDFKDYVEKIQNPLDESTPASQDESQILKSELLKLGFFQNGNDFTQLFLRGKYNQTNIKLRFGNHALKFEIDQYDKNSRSYPVNKVVDFNELNANDVITTIKSYTKGYKAGGAVTNYSQANMQDVDMLIVLKPQFEQLGFDYVTLNEGRLGFYLTMKKDDIDVKITPKGEDVEVSCFNQFVDDKEVFATTDIQGMVDFVQEMLASSKEYQTEQDEQQAFSDDSDKLYEYLDKGWFGDGDKEDLQPILDKYRHDPRLSEQVAQWERQHENWLQENNMNESNYTQSDIDYLQSIINGTLQLTLANKDEVLLELERIAEKGEIDEKLLDDAIMTYTNFVASIKVG